MQMLEQVPDSVKMSVVGAAPVLTLFGVPLEQWVFVLSAILTILFIIEKLPKAIVSLRWMYRKLFRKDGEME